MKKRIKIKQSDMRKILNIVNFISPDKVTVSCIDKDFVYFTPKQFFNMYQRCLDIEISIFTGEDDAILDDVDIIEQLEKIFYDIETYNGLDDDGEKESYLYEYLN